MLATMLFSALAVLGTSMAAPAYSDSDCLDDIPNNSTLQARFVDQIPENWPLEYWVDYDNSKLVGTVKEHQAESPLAECRAAYWGKSHWRGDGRYTDAYLICRQNTKRVAWDIKRIGEVVNCGTEKVSTTWEVTEGQTETFGANAGLEATFEGFGVNLGMSASQTSSKSEHYSQTVECDPAFKDKKCKIAGQALLELHVVEGWVNIPDADVDKKQAGKFYKTWQNGNADQEPYGMRDFKSIVHRHVDYEGYADGWNAWEGIGQAECVDIIENRHYKASKSE